MSKHTGFFMLFVVFYGLYMGLDRKYYNLEYTHPVAGDDHYVEDVTPDLQYRGFYEINHNDLPDIGAKHVLLDLDGTLVPSKSYDLELPEAHRATLNAIYNDPRFETVSVATENGSRVGAIRRALGIDSIMLFSSYYNLNEDDGLEVRRWKSNPEFWRYILHNLGMLDTPEKVVMIGDSPARDIKPAQEAGLKTVQVDRLEMHRLSMAEIFKMRENLTT